MRSRIFLALIVGWAIALPAAGQFDKTALRPAGYHPSNIAYFNTPYLANALAHGGEWFEFPVPDEEGGNFGRSLDFNDAAPGGTQQFIEGYPQFLASGQKLRGFLFGLNINNTDIRPPGWPDRATLSKGHVVLTWVGNADVRLVNCTFLPGGTESNGAETGLITNGRRSYLCNSGLTTLEVQAIQTPITDMKVWLPALDDPGTPAVDERTTTSLENQLFHPLFLERIADRDWEFIRFMDLGMTNASPQAEWTDRRKPGHIFQTGIINDQTPAPGVTFEENGQFFPIPGDRETGMAFEHMVALCNATNRNMWINVPHMASEDFMLKLAQLIRFGSNGGDPHTSVNPNATFPPLEPGLKVYIEYSNEIWSSGFAFPQGNWAEREATNDPTIDAPSAFEERAIFNARKFVDVWRVFEDVFGGDARLVRVAATFTANNTYTNAFLDEIDRYGNLPGELATAPDVLAITTYFGNGIQDFIDEEDFVTGKRFDDPYWTSPAFATDLTTAFDEWRRRMLGGDASTGSGPDATGIGGGFNGADLRQMMTTHLRGGQVPIVAYEGGPSLFTNEIDGNANTGLPDRIPTDDAVTIFVEEMNRDPRIVDLYRIHLELAKSKGLRTHTPYVDTSPWSRFGQWGHLETLDQEPATAPKYAFILEHFDLHSTLNHIEDAVAGAPSFSTAASLPPGIVGQAYLQDIVTTGGAAPRTITVVGSFLEPGLSATPGPAAGNLRISGTPTTSRKNFVLLRVVDADGDPAWQIYTLDVFGGPGTLVQSDFRGANPSSSLPWTPTFVLAPGIGWSGWTAGGGIVPRSGNDAITFAVSAGSEDEPLSQAITDAQFLSATITPQSGPIDLAGAEIRFSTRRGGDQHAPKQYALFSSVGGFAEVNAHYVSPLADPFDFDESEHILTLPDTPAFSSISSPITLRIYAFSGHFDNKDTSFTAFKLTQIIDESSAPTVPAGFVATATSTTQVSLSWTASATATSYTVERIVDNVTTTIPSAGISITDTVSPSKVIAYRVRANNAGGSSAFTSRNLATTMTFTNDPLVINGTGVKRVHLIELRAAVNAARATAGLEAAVLTDPTITVGVTRPKAVHITELRTALNQALTLLAIPLPTYTPTASSGSVVRAVHVQELRTAVK
jgi:hypothetical protein